MELTRVNATEVKHHFGKYLDEADRHPIFIIKSGKDKAVLLSYKRYEELQALEDRCWAERAMEAEKSGYLGSEETMEFLMKGMSQDGSISP